MSSMKCIIFCLSFALLCCGVFGQANSCGSHTSGNWCLADKSGYVSCPNTSPRACQPGLVCVQMDDPSGIVYCDWPASGTIASTPAPTTPPAVPTPTPVPTHAPTTASGTTTKKSSTSHKSTTTHHSSTSTTSAASTTKPTPQPTPQPTSRPTPQPTSRPTPQPTSQPTTRPTPQPTTKPSSTSGSTSGNGGSGVGPSSWPNGPVKAIYIDVGCWDADFTFNTVVDAGYNLIILAFFVSGVSWDCTQVWSGLGGAGQNATIAYAHSKGARIIASTGGSTDFPYATFTGANYGAEVANWVVKNNLDGMDFDLENFQAGFTWGGQDMVQWVADATNAARGILGAERIITHAPQPPYFGNFGWADGYGKIYQAAPSINFYLVQFYNNGPTTTYESMFLDNPNGGSVSSMVAEGIPASKIVVGKPVHVNDIGDITQGYNDAASLNQIFAQALAGPLKWNTGVMGWQWTDVTTNTAWINTIYPK